MSRLDDIAARDGWVCWLCGDAVAATAPVGSPWAASVDHVLPRAHGGGHEQRNLRLAHRRCNTRRGSRVPELEWPDRFLVQHAAALFPVLQRAQRKPGTWETVALLLDRERAQDAGAWLVTRAELVLGGRWRARRTRVGNGLVALAVSCQAV